MNEKDLLGIQGEDLAAEYLEKQGWTIVDRNVTTAFGEIDIIAERLYRRGRGMWRLLTFVEVKTRRPRKNLRPEYNVTYAKRKRIVRLAKWWLKQSKAVASARFDVIAIEWPRIGEPDLRHYESVFDANGRLN